VPTGPPGKFHDRKRGERLIHSQALLGLARRFVDVLWALAPRRPRIQPHRPDAAPATA